MSSKRGLGRGFETLIPTDLFDESFEKATGQDSEKSDLQYVEIGLVHPDPQQPRREFDQEALDELASSIKEHGVLQPIVVTADTDGGYMIVAGERRWRAATQAKLDKVPVLVRTLSDQSRLEVSLIENIQRRDLNAVETALAYVRLQDQFNLTPEEIGERMGGKSAVAIINTMRILRLPKNILELIRSGKLTAGRAAPMISMHEDDIAEILPRLLKEEWSARRIEQVAREMKAARKQGKGGSSPAEKKKILRYTDEMSRLQKRLSVPVKITTTPKGAGKVVIPFKSDEEFQRISKLIDAAR